MAHHGHQQAPSRGRGSGGGSQKHQRNLNNNYVNNKKVALSSSASSSSSDEASRLPSKASVLDRRRGLVYSGLFLVCTVVYWNALSCDFVFDDITAVLENKDLRPHVPLRNLFANDFWGTPMSKEQSHKSYRPLTVLSFRWNYWVGGTDPLGYHLVNVVLHALVTSLFFKICVDVVSCSSVVSLVASILFALHPVSNGVAWCIAGSSS